MPQRKKKGERYIPQPSNSNSDGTRVPKASMRVAKDGHEARDIVDFCWIQTLFQILNL